MRVGGIERNVLECESSRHSEFEEGACLVDDGDWLHGAVAEEVEVGSGTCEGSGVRERLTGW